MPAAAVDATIRMLMSALARQPFAPPQGPTDVTLLMASFNGRGVQRMFLNLGRELVGRGYRVTLLVCRPGGLLQREPLGGMRLVTLRPSVPTGGRLVRALLPLMRFCIGSSGMPYVSRIGDLLAYIAAERPSIIVSGGTRCNLLNSMVRHVSPVGYRAVLTEHNPISGKLRRLSRQWKLRSVKALYPYADVIAGVSAGVADELTGYLERKEPVPVLPNPVVTAEFLQSRTAALEATARALGLQKVVDMPGFMPNVAAYASAAAALALSSTYEGFGCVIVEALAYGCPVVSTDCPYGPREILADGRYGKLVASGDAAALAAALDETLAQPPDPHALKERARHYGVAAATDAYLALLFPDQPLAGSPGRSKISS